MIAPAAALSTHPRFNHSRLPLRGISQATESGDGTHAITYFHADSCTGQTAALNEHLLACMSDEYGYNFLSSDRGDITVSLGLEEFCFIPITDAWRQPVYDYADGLTDALMLLADDPRASGDYDSANELAQDARSLVILRAASLMVASDSFEYEAVRKVVQGYCDEFGPLPEDFAALVERGGQYPRLAACRGVQAKSCLDSRRARNVNGCPHVIRALGIRTYKMAGHHANVSYGHDTGHGGMLWAVMGTVRRPNATFGAISRDPGRYLASSVAMFAIVCLAPVLQSATAWLEPNYVNNFGSGAWPHAISLVNPVILNFLIIAMIFWIGGWHGKNRRFKDMFPMLSYCLVPMVFLAAAATGIHLLDMQAHMHGGDYLGGDSLDPDPDLSPSFAIEFAGPSGIRLIQTAFTAFFMVWAFVLFVKAMKTSHGFGTGRAVGVVALAAAATYALEIALAVVPAVLGELFLSPRLT